MRVTADAKAGHPGPHSGSGAGVVRAGSGFDAATTREIATAARIAAGTLFNYFPTKEAIAVALAAEAMARRMANWKRKGLASRSLRTSSL